MTKKETIKLIISIAKDIIEKIDTEKELQAFKVSRLKHPMYVEVYDSESKWRKYEAFGEVRESTDMKAFFNAYMSSGDFLYNQFKDDYFFEIEETICQQVVSKVKHLLPDSYKNYDNLYSFLEEEWGEIDELEALLLSYKIQVAEKYEGDIMTWDKELMDIYRNETPIHQVFQKLIESYSSNIISFTFVHQDHASRFLRTANGEWEIPPLSLNPEVAELRMWNMLTEYIERPDEDAFFSCIVRVVDVIKFSEEEKGFAHVYGFYYGGGIFESLPAEQLKEAFSTDAETGEPIPVSDMDLFKEFRVEE